MDMRSNVCCSITLQDAWTEEEESLLVAAHLRYGNRWSDIAKVIRGRTENAVKNHCE